MVFSVALAKGNKNIDYLVGVDMYYTYILESKNFSDKTYIGYTSDLRKRLMYHNWGSCKHTSKYRPWMIKVYTAFQTKEQARAFELYLKSGSGKAFAKRHFNKLTSI